MEFFRVCYLDECNHAIMQMHRLHQPDELQEKETKFQPCYWISNNPMAKSQLGTLVFLFRAQNQTLLIIITSKFVIIFSSIDDALQRR